MIPHFQSKSLKAACRAFLLFCAVPAARADLPQYTVQKLSGWWDPKAYNAVSINDAGEILIRTMVGENEFGLVKDGVRTATLTTPPAGYYEFDGGKGLNNAGQALADLDSLTSEGVGIADMRTGVLTALPDPPQNSDDDLNPRMSPDASKVVVQGGSALQPWLYDGAGTWKSLGGLTPGGAGRAFGVNDAGKVVGRTTDSAGNTVPFVWTAGAGMEAITDHSTPVYGQATAINSQGFVTGIADGRAFVLNTGNMELTWITPEADQQATDINDAGQIIGTFWNPPFLGVPGDAAWIATEEDGFMPLENLIGQDLSSPEWRVFGATDINNDGLILASAYNYKEHQGYQVLLRPVPEPEAAALLALGALAFAGRRRKELTSSPSTA